MTQDFVIWCKSIGICVANWVNRAMFHWKIVKIKRFGPGCGPHTDDTLETTCVCMYDVRLWFAFNFVGVLQQCCCLKGHDKRMNETRRGRAERFHTLSWRSRVYVHALTVCTSHIHAHIYDAPANATTFHTQILYTKHVQARNRVKPALHCTNECFIYDKYLFILFGAFSQSAFIQQLQQHLQQQQQRRILQVHCVVVKFYIVTAARYSWWRIDNIYIYSLSILLSNRVVFACMQWIHWFLSSCTLYNVSNCTMKRAINKSRSGWAA